MAFQKVTSLQNLWSGEMLGVVVCGVKVLLVNAEGRVAAYEDQCAHQKVRLSEGTLKSHRLTCRAHHWEYDVRTGRCANPETVSLKTFPVKLENGDIYVDVTQPVLENAS